MNRLALASIPVYKPRITAREKAYVEQCLDSTWISSKGEFIDRFEKGFADYVSAKEAVTVFNGTVALHLALLALGIREGDEVLVPSLTYVASANAVKYCGAEVVFADACCQSWQIDPEKVMEKINARTKAIMAVHLYGHPCEMEALSQIARERGLFLVEDCAESFGSYYQDRHVGTFGDIATFSFFGNKTISCGEGGMVVTQKKELAEVVRHLKNQGLAKAGGYFHDRLGYNYRMTNIQASIGLAQLEQAESILQDKRRIALSYAKRLPQFLFQGEEPSCVNSFWMCSFIARSPKEREEIRSHLAQNGVETRPFFTPCHLMPYYGGKEGEFPVAERLSTLGINLPSFPDLTEAELEYICALIHEVAS